MRIRILAAGLAVATLIPSIALAQQSCEQQRDNRVAGTIAGAGIGAVLGSVIAGHGDRTAGALIGGVGGGLAGNQLAKPNADCAHAYGYYDRAGAWHANAVERAQAVGYYDRNGAWIDGAPNGGGYYDAHNRYVPVSATSYYDTDGQLVSGAAPGYYDGSGRWVAGPAMGRYDNNGRWMSGQAAGHRDANGVWVADAQPGYYDNGGRWRAGQVQGYYDAQGRWTATSDSADNRGGDYRGSDRSNWNGAPSDVRSRVAWLDQRVRRGAGNGALSRGQANRALQALASIRQDEINQRHRDGRLGARDGDRLMARLDDVNDNLRWTRRDGRREF